MEVPWTERAAPPRTLLVAAAICAALTALSIALIDVPVAHWISVYEPSPFWERGIEILEWAVLLPFWRFALAAFLVGNMLAAVALKRWRAQAPAWMFVAGVYLVAWFSTTQFKDATGRLRPLQWISRRHDETFGWQSGVSFPSGHVTLFASVVIPLVVLFPRLRPLLAIVVFVALARIGVSAHFVSDTLAAVTLVLMWTWLVGWLVRPCRR